MVVFFLRHNAMIHKKNGVAGDGIVLHPVVSSLVVCDVVFSSGGVKPSSAVSS